MENTLFIRGRHVNTIMKKGKIKKVVTSSKDYYWKIPSHLVSKLKKGDLVLVYVNNVYAHNGVKRDKPLKQGVAIIDDIVDDYMPPSNISAKCVRSKYSGSKARVLKGYIESGNINKYIKDESLAKKIADKCNLSERSINSLLKKHGEEKVKKAIEMFLAVDDRKAPLKFIKLILENI